jgi:hypothetical protein
MGRWRCWTNNCHQVYGTGLIGLVRATKKYSLEFACNYIMNICGDKLNEVNIDDTEWYIHNTLRNKMKYDNRTYPDEVKTKIASLNHDVPYFKDRGFTVETLNAFQAFHCVQNKHPLLGRACLPIFNLHDQLVGFGGRATNQMVTDKKWLYCPTGIKLGQNLFGINLAKNHIRQTHTAIIVEGPGDAMKVYQSGIFNCVSTFSNKITFDQIKILMSLGVTNILCLFDGDEAGDNGWKQVQNETNNLFNITRILLPENNDPGSLSEEQLRNLIYAN